MDVISSAAQISTASSEGIKVASTIAKWVNFRRQRTQDAKSCLELLGLNENSEYSFRVGMQHPLMQLGTPHPDDAEAFTSIFVPKILKYPEEIIRPSHEIYSPLSDNIVAIGSPEAEILTQILFGYDRIDGSGLQYSGDTIDLPYRWLENPSEVSTEYLRPSNSGEDHWRPNWPIVSEVGVKQKKLYPKVGKDGRLRSDYLLITRVPNYLGDGIGLGRSFVSIAGSHGIGTKAIKLFVRNKNILAKVWSELGDPSNQDSFQVLCRANKVVSRGNGFEATSLELLDVQVIDSFDTKWDSAREHATRRMRSVLLNVV